MAVVDIQVVGSVEIVQKRQWDHACLHRSEIGFF